MTTRNRKVILAEIEQAIAELRGQSGWLNDRRIERLELEREWILSHPSPVSHRAVSSNELPRTSDRQPTGPGVRP